MKNQRPEAAAGAECQTEEVCFIGVGGVGYLTDLNGKPTGSDGFPLMMKVVTFTENLPI